MQPIDIASLNFLSKAGLCWSFFWRGLVVTLASMVLGGLLGGVFGFILGLLGLAKAGATTLAQSGGALLGLLTGAVCFYFYVKWLLSARLGRFRLLLVRADGAE